MKINYLVTISHLALVLLYTLLSMAHFFGIIVPYKSSVNYYKVSSAWTFVGGVADLFITCMIWFVLDEQASPDVFSHG